MILLLLSRFRECKDSLTGYQVCQKLAQDGHDLCVTSTSAKGGDLESEIKDAARMRSKYPGSVRILQPECEEYDEPNPEWIEKHYRTYFRYLEELENVEVIISTLPGTTRTAVELKTVLKCNLILLATTNIGTDQGEFKVEINGMAKHANVIWSVGPDLFAHFQDIFKESGDLELISKHKQILLKPDANTMNYLPYPSSPGVRKVISIWNDGFTFAYKGRRIISKGSNLQNFFALGGALGNINEQKVKRQETKIQWLVHGLKSEEKVTTSIRSQANGNTVGLIPLKEANSLDDVKLHNCLAFLVPDVYEETFNFKALAAIWHGTPTLVPSESSIGKWLRTLPCADKTHAIVTLTGDVKTDKDIWKTKIYKDILNRDAKPWEWAKRLSQFLHNNLNLWTLHLPLPTNGKETERAMDRRRALSKSHNDIYTTMSVSKALA